jgi:hypothetical protein
MFLTLLGPFIQAPMKKLTTLLLLFSVLAFSSCDKEEETGDVTLVTARDNMKAEIILNDLFEIVTYYINQDAPFSSVRYPCIDEVQSATSEGVVTFEVDFGPDNCNDEDLRRRKGVINFTADGDLDAAGTTIVITTEDFLIDDYEWIGEVMITNEGENNEGDIEFQIVSNGITIIAPLNDYQVEWQATHPRTWVEGAQSNLVEDDEFLITGMGTGTARTDKSFSFIINESLTSNIICKYFKSGQMDVNPSGALTRAINYGDGSCDKKAVINVNNRDYDVDIE